jgi:hypothetical protein
MDPKTVRKLEEELGEAIADSQELLHNSGLPESALIVVGHDTGWPILNRWRKD